MSYWIEVNCVNAEKPVLTYLPNPHIPEIKKSNKRFQQLVFSEEMVSSGDQLPVHIILGAADIQRIKSTEPAVLGDNSDCDPVAELTTLGWVVSGLFPLAGTTKEKGFFLKSSLDEFQQMCCQEAVGLSDEVDAVDSSFHENFKS